MKAWMGVTPPPRGQGYYAGDYADDYLYAFNHRYVTRPTETGYAIDSYINDVIQKTLNVEEELITDAVIELLRKKGYTVTEPEEEA